MFEPMHPAAILSYAETLAKAIEYTNSREESVPRRDAPEPESEPGGGARVSALRRRWLFARNAACLGVSEALYWCARSIRFASGVRHRLSRLADRFEMLCPLDHVGFCAVCEARELFSHMVFAQLAVCEGCVKYTLDRANALRLPSEPVMTETFFCELLGLHRVPQWRLDGWHGDASPAVLAREAQDVEIRRARMLDMGDLETAVCRRWLVAIAPVAARLETFADLLRTLKRRDEVTSSPEPSETK